MYGFTVKCPSPDAYSPHMRDECVCPLDAYEVDAHTEKSYANVTTTLRPSESRHETRHCDPRESPRHPISLRPSTPILPAGPTAMATSISTDAPTFTVSATNVHESHSVSICNEATSEFLQSEHTRHYAEAGMKCECNGMRWLKPCAP